MSILVLGASSQIGYFTLRRLRAQGHDVLAVSRKSGKSSDCGVRWLVGGLEGLAIQSGLDAVISYGPLLGLARWLALHDRAPAPRLVATSSMSVLTKQASAVAAERLLVASLADGEAQVQAQCRRLGMVCTVLRPTLIYGAGRDRSLTPIAQRAMRWRLAVLPKGDGWRQPVHADDLALAVECLMAGDLADGQILSVGGGERLRATQMFLRVHAALPKTTLTLPVPQVPLRMASAVLPSIRGPVSRLSADLVADNGPFRKVLGFEPRDFRPAACMLGVGLHWQEELDASPLRRLETA